MPGSGAGGLAALPWRGPAAGRPALPLPPAPMPLRYAGTLRKSWRYVGLFCDELLLCAARVSVGPVGQTFWALLERGGGTDRRSGGRGAPGEGTGAPGDGTGAPGDGTGAPGEGIRERTRLRLPFTRGEVWSELPGGGAWPLGGEGPAVITRIEAGELSARLAIDGGRWVESICPNGAGGFVWTRKRIAAIDAELTIAGRAVRVEGHGVEDESAGYHPRRTVWSWSAGVGAAADGRAVGWNLVSGVNDPPERSERAIWVDGEPFEPGSVRFDGLDGVDFDDGARLRFAAEAERRDERNLLAVRYSYRQPFGSFTGTLPGGIELAAGLGVMEHHDALW